MSTRALIGVVQDDQTIQSVYHHFDGYPDWLGTVLEDKYNSKEEANHLISGGGMSCCWTQSRWSSNGDQYKVQDFGAQYYTERGDDLRITTTDNFEEFIKLDWDNEYSYLFKDGKWHGYEIIKTRDQETWVITDIDAFPVSIPQSAKHTEFNGAVV